MQRVYTDWQLGAETGIPVDLAAAYCTTIGPKDFKIMTIMSPVFRNGQVQEFIVDRSLTVAARKRAAASPEGSEPRASASGLSASFAVTPGVLKEADSRGYQYSGRSRVASFQEAEASHAGGLPVAGPATVGHPTRTEEAL